MLPHAGLIEPSMPRDEEALLRAKLHVRGGRKRLSKGDNADAVAALYDAFISAMWRFVVSPDLWKELVIHGTDDLSDDLTLFHVMKRSGAITSSFDEDDFMKFATMLDQALDGQAVSFDNAAFLKKYEAVMKELGVLPIKQGELPERDSITV